MQITCGDKGQKALIILGIPREISLLRCSAFPSILLQRGIAKLPFGMPPPFLGVSSLNLAAPPGAAFFLPGYSAACAVVPARGMSSLARLDKSCRARAIRAATHANPELASMRSSSR